MRNLQVLIDEISVEEKDFPEEETGTGNYAGDKITDFIQLKIQEEIRKMAENIKSISN